MEHKQLIVILADLSGYTRFMLENRTAALHGQFVVNRLIESILAEVDIPLTLQEIEGDAVFLYAAHPGSDREWATVVEQVSRKLMKFFDAFIAGSATITELTPCECAICAKGDQLGLKIVVHAGEAVFHSIAGRAQVSGPDVILAHRLLKNSVASSEYLLLSEAAFDLMGRYMPDGFVAHQETYAGFGTVSTRVRPLDEQMLAARDALYAMDSDQLDATVEAYMHAVLGDGMRRAALQQVRNPTRPLSWLDKALLLWDVWVGARLNLRKETVTGRVVARGKRRPPSLAASG